MSRLKRERPAQIAMQWVTLLLSLIVLSIGLVLVVAAPAEAEQFATLHPLEGTVEVADDGKAFRPGRDGQVLGAGDTIRTGADGRAEIEYFDGSLTRLENDTTFLLEELATNRDVPGSKTIVAEQERGRTFERVVALTDSESRFDVETPTATASVRGTTYVLSRLPDGTVTLWVLPDDDPEIGEVVLILDDGSEIVVTEGQGVIVFPDGLAGAPFDLTDAQLSDAWVLYNLCELDALPLEECETEEDVFEPIDPLDPEEPEEPEEPDVLGENDRNGNAQPDTTPPAPPTFTSGGGGSTGTSGGGDAEPQDTTPPKTTITERPNDPTRSRTATFRFRANEPVRSFECSLDGGSYSRCNSGRTYTGLSDGTHLFRVRATDKAGNRENTASHRWTIDNQPPDTVIDSGPGGNCEEFEETYCESTNASFEFHSTEAGSTFECQLERDDPVGRSDPGGSDPHGWEPCTSPRTYSNLSPGDGQSYTFSVRATDPAGNTDPTPDSETWFACPSCFNETVDRSESTAAGGATDEGGSSEAGESQDVVSTINDVVEGVADTVTEAIDEASGLTDDLDDAKDDLLDDPKLSDAPNLLP